MKKFTLILTALLMISFSVLAQIKMVVHLNDAESIEVYASSVDSITFTNFPVEPDDETPDDSDKPGDSEVEDSEEDEITLPVVEAPGEGYTTIVLYIPESSCDEAEPYILGVLDGNNIWSNEPDRAMESLGNGWWQVTVEALTPENATNFKFRMDDGRDGWDIEPKGSYELLEGADQFLKIKEDEWNNLVAISDCDNQVLYIKSGEWSNTPCIEPVPAGRAKFVLTVTGLVPEDAEIVFTGTFEENSWTESDRVMTKQADGTYVWEGEYPKNFRFKAFISNAYELGLDDYERYLWLCGDDFVVELESGSVIEFTGCFCGLCPGDIPEDIPQEPEVSEPTGYKNGYGYVDLGLPSGTKWATMNVGTDSPEDYGDYFAWGETEPKDYYDWSTYKWCNGSYNTQTKYCTSSSYGTVDNKTTLELTDDAAYVNWGTSWRMPTKAEQDELRNTSYTTWTWTTQNGVNGYKVTSKTNGNSIFLPAAGYRSGSSLGNAGSYCGYWGSSLSVSYSDRACNLGFDSDGISWYYYDRDYGHSVRPVLRNVEFTVMFDGNGGEGTMPTIDVQHDDNVSIPISTFTREGYAFIGWNTKADGTGTSYTAGESITLTTDLTLYAQWEEYKDTGTANGHDWVDLGLPSGTKWATMNLGADSPEEYGDYFAWGEIEPKNNYDWSTYKWCNGSYDTQTKYCTSSSYGTVDNKTTLELTDDAAYVNWGTSWRMPTKAELDELRNTSYTTWTWTTQNGVNGYKVTSKTNGNSIFLPAAGCRFGSSLYYAGSDGDYWSSSLSADYSNYAYYLLFDSDDVYSSRYHLSSGYSVRPVLR